MDTKFKKDGLGEMEKSLSLISKSLEPPPKVILNDLEKAAVMEMRKLYVETLKVDVDIQTRIYKVEKMLEPRFEIFYDRRSKLLSEYRKKVLATNNVTDYKGQIAYFWLNVLKASFADLITEDDEKILYYLTDVRSKMVLEPEVKFILTFFFEPNEFFSNKILTKTYLINILPDLESPLTYDGAEVIGSEGCHIDWKYERHDNSRNSNKSELPRLTSFFDFFNPPKMAAGNQNDDLNYNSDMRYLLQKDYDMGSFLKERVIPQAVLFFTREIVDCQNSETDSDEEVDEEIEEKNIGRHHEEGDEKRNKADDANEDGNNDGKSAASVAKSNNA